MAIDVSLKNAWWKLLSLAVSSLMPLYVLPRLVQVFGVEYYGSLELLLTRAAFFQIFIHLGANILGQRFIADSNGRIDANALSIIKITLLATPIVILSYALFAFSLSNAIADIKWLYLLFLVTATFNVDWIYEGRLEFRAIAFRNVVVKIIQVGLIMSLVTEYKDSTIYLIILFIPPLVGHIMFFGRLEVPFAHLKAVKLKYTLVSSLVWVFVLQNASMLYTQSDKLILGGDLYELGLYSISQKISIYVFGVLSAVVVVFYPYLNRVRNFQSYSTIVKQLLQLVNILVSFIGVSVILFYEEISVYFLSDSNIQFTHLLVLWVLRLGIVMNESVINVQILLVNGKERISALLFLFCGIGNIGVMLLMGSIDSTAALLSTMICELALLLMLRYHAKAYVKLSTRVLENLGDLMIWIMPGVIFLVLAKTQIIFSLKILILVSLALFPALKLYRFNKILLNADS